ncbi:hypothetical protein K437DRAFT_270248 [Tilletiaria anomala UBC 951]|uniref:Transcription activator GCR1-like domain-containing protein n=1 Tax=Tilletiaria anomala (strain ATCC 24038 / CBS 436.72 / UBC 951) TaxID=1037660 RepID=A0A066VLI3_TILAU|nr:uncharacterized protein K437DRAFT_270248 [Tilletiaria anomala UBC 951]KDN39629.1 hypothetical protein K437DRAFT_270248 [Tilletiaria anomala UBC 951]
MADQAAAALLKLFSNLPDASSRLRELQHGLRQHRGLASHGSSSSPTPPSNNGEARLACLEDRMDALERQMSQLQQTCAEVIQALAVVDEDGDEEDQENEDEDEAGDDREEEQESDTDSLAKAAAHGPGAEYSDPDSLSASQPFTNLLAPLSRDRVAADKAQDGADRPCASATTMALTRDSAPQTLVNAFKTFVANRAASSAGAGAGAESLPVNLPLMQRGDQLSDAQRQLMLEFRQYLASNPVMLLSLAENVASGANRISARPRNSVKTKSQAPKRAGRQATIPIARPEQYVGLEHYDEKALYPIEEADERMVEHYGALQYPLPNPPRNFVPGDQLTYTLSRTTQNVVDLWKEWHFGLSQDQPSVIFLEAVFKTSWRWTVNARKQYSQRKVIIDEVHAVMKGKEWSLGNALRHLELARAKHSLSMFADVLRWRARQGIPPGQLADEDGDALFRSYNASQTKRPSKKKRKHGEMDTADAGANEQTA